MNKGDYVLATKYSDGDCADQWAVGFFDRLENGRYLVVNDDGGQFRVSGFRRCELISQEEGDNILSAFMDNCGFGVSLWEFIGRDGQE